MVSLRDASIFVVAILIVNGAAADAPAEQLSLRVSQFVCNGDIESLVREGRHVREDSIYFLPTKLTMLLDPSELSGAIETIKNTKYQIKGLTETERVVFASALIRVGSKDIFLVKKLLDFNSNDSVIESYRKYHQARVEYNSSPTLSLDRVIQAFYELPYVDSYLLHQIFLLGFRDRNPLLVLKQFFPYVDKLPIDSAERYLLLSDKNYIVSKISGDEVDPTLIQEAYQRCPYSFDIALLYSSSLMNLKKLDMAEQVLVGLVKKFPVYPAYVDLSLAEIYFSKKDFQSGKIYFDKASQRKEMLEKDNQKALEILEKSRINKFENLSVIIVSALLAVGAILFVTFRKKKRVL